MKPIFLSCILTAGLFIGTSQALAQGQQCRHGLSWTISKNKAWGYGLPVVTSVKPYSSAAQAGLKPADIIEEIDGYKTERLSAEQIQQLLSTQSDLHALRTSNIGAVGTKRLMGLNCKSSNSLSERQLAELFSLYSVEDANLQRITYPYSYTQSAAYPLLSARSFDFAPSAAHTADTDKLINKEIQSMLEQRGMQQIAGADLVVSTYYHINPLKENSEELGDGEGFSWRYDAHSSELRPLPVFGMQHPSISQAKYKLTLGVQIQSRESKDLVWSCEANEYLSEAISIAEYAQTAVATMLTGFPFVHKSNAPEISVQTLRYNYTGILYSKDKLNLIVDIENNSPALRAGLRPGDLILAINGQRLEQSNSGTIVAGYLQQAERMERHRDKNLPPLQSLVDNIPASYWRINSYETIASILGKGNNHLAFTYLFAFRPYILGSEGKTIIYEILREGSVYYVPILPEYRNESSLSIQ